ncbi:MAG: histidinol-phosphate transaminase [Bacilli bacterium]
MTEDGRRQTAQRSVAQRLLTQVRPELHRIKPYVPGRPSADVQREFGLATVDKLASNENPLGPSPKALAAIVQMLGELNRYPDGAAQDVRSAIADHAGLTPSHVFVGNGSDEIIKMVSETFLSPGDEVVTPFPSFAQYGFGASIMGATVVNVPLTEGFRYDWPRMLASITERTKIVYLCSPNNPTGTWFTHGEAADFVAQAPDHVVIVCDEAYIDYVDEADPLDSLQFIREGRTVLSLRTFSKMYGLAGIRLGYALGDPGLINFMHQVREPFNANSVAQAAAVAALTDTEHVARCREANRAGREQFYKGLAALDIPYIATQGNFLIADVGDGVAVFEQLQRRGVIVRAGFPGLDRYVRISIGAAAENERCLKALAQVIASIDRVS